MPSLLIAIASYGTAQDHYLEKLLTEYRKLAMPVRIVVLTNCKKPVHGAEVLVGLPSRNPYSLPFAHRKLFAENAGKYEHFIYTEDDTLLTEKHITSFLEMQPKLADDEILGFVRSETDPLGQKYITSINHHFRWLPDTVVTRGGELFAQLSNYHSGCFIATRQQLQKAIASGGFLVEPRSRMYGMLETAASDIYTQCGLRRLICLSRIQEFIVPHLANKYYSRMGIPAEELDFQVETLSDIYQNGRWRGSLLNPQTKVHGFRWSKNLYERSDKELLRAMPSSAKNVLSIGSDSGENELWLKKNGINVCAIPVDAVFAAALRRRGIRTVEGPFDSVIEEIRGQQFDTVLMADVLHLVKNPVDWLQKLRNLLMPDGWILASISHTTNLLSWVKDWREGHGWWMPPTFETNNVQPTSVRRLRRWCRSSGLELMQVVPVITSSRNILRQIGFGPLKATLASRFILKAKKAKY